ncbi:MAG: hypothetical protein P4L59_11380 [Desulfosporosinus sp.]|nr:hypothetical protein [Desulfosporosinus sp.]
MSKLETKLSNFDNALQRLKEADKKFNKQGASDVVCVYKGLRYKIISGLLLLLSEKEKALPSY